MDNCITNTKVCATCKKDLPANNDYFTQNGERLRGSCKICTEEKRKINYLKNRDKILSRRRKNYPKIKHKREQAKQKRIDDFLSKGNWKKIKGYEIYWISDKGQVYTEHHEKFLNQADNGNGYMFVNLWKNNIPKHFYVHRLVMQYFGDGEEKETVNHKDGNKSNNHISNLEWATQQENQQHAIKTGLWKNQLKNHPDISTPVEQRTVEGKLIKIFPSMRQAQRETGCDATSIGHSIRKGWVVGGYRWYFKGKYEN